MRNTWLLGLILLGSAPAAAQPGDDGATGAAPPADARTWRYDATIEDVTEDGELRKKELRVDLRETGRRTVKGRAVVDLAPAQEGRPLGPELMAELSPAPFTTFAPALTLVYAPKGGIWLVMGETPAGEEEIAAAMKQPPTFRAAKDLPAREKLRVKPDRWQHYRDRVGAWDSACGGEEHPSPVSGDSYTSSLCYAPGVGLTRIRFDSVWGSFGLTLATPPERPELPR